MKPPRNPPSISLILTDPRNSSCILSPATGRIAENFNKRYLHWTEVKFRDTSDIDPDIVWTRMKLSRKDSAHVLNFGSFQIQYNITNDIQRQLHRIDTLPSTGYLIIDPLYPRMYDEFSINCIMEESIASSQIEGADTSSDCAKNILRKNSKPQNLSERMIVNNYRAMQTVVSKKDETLTKDLILDIHRYVTYGTIDNEYSGKFRTDNNIVVSDPSDGTIYYTPIDSNEIESAIDSLCTFINNDEEFIHPVIKGIILHFMIAFIHPFQDGNGRVARTLFYWYMLGKGYSHIEYLSVSKYIKSHRGRYSDAYQLSETDDNDITYFLKFNLDVIEEAIDNLPDIIDNFSSDFDLDTMNLDINHRQKNIISYMINEKQNISVEYIMNRYGVSKNTARSDIRKLIESGILTNSGKDGHRVLYSISDDFSIKSESDSEKE